MASERDLRDSLLEITQSLGGLRRSVETIRLGAHHAAIIDRLDHAAQSLNALLGQLQPKAPARPCMPARPPTPPAMTSCPTCGALVKPTNLARHMQKVHSTPGMSQMSQPKKSSQPKRRREAQGPDRLPLFRAESVRRDPGKLSGSETLRAITTELELLNLDLYRDD